ERVLVRAAFGIAVGNASAGACGCGLLLRLRLFTARDAAQAKPLFLRLVFLFVRLLILIVVFLLVAARQTRGAFDVHRDRGDRFRLEGDVLLVASFSRGLACQFFIGNLLLELADTIFRRGM